MKTFLLLFLLTLSAWAHESGALPADSLLTVSREKGLVYQVTFSGPAAAAEWLELDKNGDGRVDAEEKAGYLQAEPWWSVPFQLRANGHDVSVKPVFDWEGNRQKLVFRFSAALPKADGLWQLRHQGALALSGKHHYHTDFPAQFAIEAVPQLSWQSDSAGAPGDWDWDNRAGDLDQALQSKSLWGALLLAFGLGAIHALTPGHGKTIVGAYLIGSRGTVPQAILLGIVVTVTHTFSVILLGMVCLFFFQKYLPPTLIPWIGVASGLLMTLLGLTLLSGDVPTFIHHHHHDDDGHGHHHHGPGGHHHHHHHHMPDKLTLGGLLSLGITGGMVPCPEALAVLLTALALNKLVLGLLILLAFSGGLAFVLVLIGIVMVKAARLLERRYPSQGMISRMSDVSYTLMVIMGMVIAIRAYLSTL